MSKTCIKCPPGKYSKPKSLSSDSCTGKQCDSNKCFIFIVVKQFKIFNNLSIFFPCKQIPFNLYYYLSQEHSLLLISHVRSEKSLMAMLLWVLILV